MMLLQKIIAVFLMLGSPSSLLGAPNVVRMHTGDVKTLRLENTGHLFVSKRGIISLNHDRGDYWTIAALRAGVVNIHTTLDDGQTGMILIDVTPRHPRSNHHLAEKTVKATPEDETCLGGKLGDIYQIKSTIELADNSSKENLGFDAKSGIRLAPGKLELGFSAHSEPRMDSHHRQIIANPMIRAKPCYDVSIRTGGEDAVETKTDEGRSITTWKSHGLDLNVKLIPVSQYAVRLPFSISLRTPSKGQGNYGVTDVHSEIDSPLNHQILAAVINLSSTAAFEQNQFWLAWAPIIGPLFKRKDDSKAASKMLVWFEISHSSVDNITP